MQIVTDLIQDSSASVFMFPLTDGFVRDVEEILYFYFPSLKHRATKLFNVYDSGVLTLVTADQESFFSYLEQVISLYPDTEISVNMHKGILSPEIFKFAESSVTFHTDKESLDKINAFTSHIK